MISEFSKVKAILDSCGVTDIDEIEYGGEPKLASQSGVCEPE